jgi:hypothetical protein
VDDDGRARPRTHAEVVLLGSLEVVDRDRLTEMKVADSCN